MGTWGSGNFNDDKAADYLAMFTGKLVSEIEAATASPSNIEPDEPDGVLLPCKVELLTLIAGRGYPAANLPTVETAEAWKAKYLTVWDAYIDRLKPDVGFKAERREVLVKTFDELAELAKERAEARSRARSKKTRGGG